MTIGDLINKIITVVLTPAITLLFSLATVLFLWGVINYVIGSQGNQTKLEQGKKVMVWGIIGMAIMVSAWGIVGILCRFFGTCQGSSPPTYLPTRDF